MLTLSVDNIYDVSVEKLPTLEQNNGKETKTASSLRAEISSTNVFIVVPEQKLITRLWFILLSGLEGIMSVFYLIICCFGSQSKTVVLVSKNFAKADLPSSRAKQNSQWSQTMPCSLAPVPQCTSGESSYQSPK